MATTYSKESHATTTHATERVGYGIMCDNQDIYCDSEDYYCDGSVVMTDISYTSTTHTKESY